MITAHETTERRFQGYYDWIHVGVVTTLLAFLVAFVIGGIVAAIAWSTEDWRYRRRQEKRWRSG